MTFLDFDRLIQQQRQGAGAELNDEGGHNRNGDESESDKSSSSGEESDDNDDETRLDSYLPKT